jgi:hypothetical protein
MNINDISAVTVSSCLLAGEGLPLAAYAKTSAYDVEMGFRRARHTTLLHIGTATGPRRDELKERLQEIELTYERWKTVMACDDESILDSR